MALYKKTTTSERANILDSEVGLILQTKEITSSLAGADGIVVKGTPFPSNNSSCVGLVFEDIDMTGDTKRPGSVIVAGRIIEANLPVQLDSDAKTALAASGIVLA